MFLLVHFPMHIPATVYNLHFEQLYPSHCSNGIVFFYGVFSTKGRQKKKKKLDTDNDRNISGCKDAPDSLALPPSQWFQTI